MDHRIGDVQVPLLIEYLVHVLFPEINDEFYKVGQFLLGVVFVIPLKLNGILISFIADFNIPVEFLIVGIVQQNEIMLGNDRKICKRPSFFSWVISACAY